MTEPTKDPLIIAEQGYFFAGGSYTDSETGKAYAGQIYVEYQIPQIVRSPYPLIMIHGGFQTGTNWTGTPDGREGWAQFFLRRGWPVYVVDTVGRGRASGSYDAYGQMRHPRLDFTRQRFAAPSTAMLWPQAAQHTQFPGKPAPGEP